MRRVDDPKMLRESLTAAMREAEGAFGDPTAFIEQAVGRPRHIEVQILADTRATPSICSSAIARSSGGTRRSSRSRRLHTFRPSCARRSAATQCALPSRSTTPARALWSS